MRTNRNRIVVVGDRVLRYPLTDADRRDLPAIAERHRAARAAGLPAPRVLAVHDDHLVLQRMPGEPLITTDLAADAQRRLGEELADLLQALREVAQWPAPALPWAQLWAELADVSGDAAAAQAARLAAGLRPAPVHGDLSGGNLLVTDDGRLVGVLDWDGATLADPAQDFSALCANVPPGVAAAVRAGVPDAAQLEHRAAVYMATWGVQDRLWRQGRHPWLNRVLT